MTAMTMQEINQMNGREPALAYELATEEFRKDPERLAAFLESCSTEREVCVPFGAISIPELLAMMRNPRATDEQVVLAVRELDRRALANDTEELAARAAELAIGVLS